MEENEPLTSVLNKWVAGEDLAFAQIFEAIELDLRAACRAHLRHNTPITLLETSDFTNEVAIALVEATKPEHFDSRQHFFGWLHGIKRNIYARALERRKRIKRGSELIRVPLDEILNRPTTDSDHNEFYDLIDRLSEKAPDLAHILFLHGLMGLTYPEIAECTDLTVDQISKKLRIAKAQFRALTQDSST